MLCKLTIVDDVLNRTFYKLGLCVGKRPGYFIIIPILLTLLMITGYQRIHYEMDPEYLFSPVQGQGKLERSIVEEYFKVNYSHRFNVGRITRAGMSILLFLDIMIHFCSTFFCYLGTFYKTKFFFFFSCCYKKAVLQR